MPVVVSCLRGVNVGGHRRIKMEFLRHLATSCGATQVGTFIQSGNLVCRITQRNPQVFSQALEESMERELGFRADVISRTATELDAIVAANPFPEEALASPAKLHLTLLPVAPTPEAVERALALIPGAEQMRFAGREIYSYFPDGIGKSKMPWAKLDRLLGIGTARNWNTVLELLKMAQGLRQSRGPH